MPCKAGGQGEPPPGPPGGPSESRRRQVEYLIWPRLLLFSAISNIIENMFKRWEKIDIAIAILFVLTNISYLFLRDSAFTPLLWILIIAVITRILLIVKKKLFWQIRNRLIFSGLFFVVTPLLFMAIFFYLVLNIILAQYGIVIMDNLMSRRQLQLEQSADNYLKADKGKQLGAIHQLVRYDRGFLNVLFFEKEDGVFKPYFKFPANFDESRIVMREFSGYYFVGDRLYYGALKKNETKAVLMGTTVNQEFLDDIGKISDFHMRYHDPYKSNTKMALEIATDPKLGVNNEATFSVPWTYNYKFLDFNAISQGFPTEKTSYFFLFLDIEKLFQKVTSVGSSTHQASIKKGFYLLTFLFATFIIISFIIGFRSIRVITRSINLITRGTQRIRNGDFSFRIKTRSGDQLQYLAESFNEMAAGIDRLLLEEKERQRLEEELRIARSIQLKLLPPDKFEAPEFELAAVNIPAAEIAGDYFDYFYKPDTYLSILVADVSGKGTSAAFYMAELKGVINHLQKKEISPAKLIFECHDSLKDSFDRVTFITMSMAKFIIPEKKFIFSRAGHTQALFYDTQKKSCIELFPHGVAIGLFNFSSEKNEEIEVQYKSGDILFLFSDGLSEIMNDEEEMLGVDNLKRILCANNHLSAIEIKQKLLDFSIEYAENEVNHDDLTFIILKVK